MEDQEILDMFRNNPAPPAENTFEFALVLGGTVSSGAYTAGAMDFIIGALDAWTRLRDAGEPSAPRHKVLLKTITGTSGGGVNAAIAARALAFDFPHVVRSTQNPGPENPFYEVWVNQLDLHPLLDTGDLQSGQVLSLLSGKAIDEAAAYIENFSAQPSMPRSYIADPLLVILTLTNLRGIPYRTEFGEAGSLWETFVDHADFARFDVVYPWQNFNSPRGDEWTVGFDGSAEWSDFSRFARATAAFPVGLPPRQLSRPREHYRYRATVLPGDGSGDISLLAPDWAMMGGETGDYVFVSVDGGATDNEPIQLARTSLSGLLGRNPRNGIVANRGVLLVDPFAGNIGLGEESANGLLDVGKGLMDALIQQTRYGSSDILLAQHPDVYSRFMISAERNGLLGDKALATAGFGAFMGFACEAFRRHDYLLGRANAQAYLRNMFVLPEDNVPVFRGCWTPQQITQHGVPGSDGKTYLPIIPLMGDAAIPEGTDPFPKHMLNPEDFRSAIEDRFSAIIEAEGSGGLVSSVAAWFLARMGEGKVADLVVGRMKQSLDEWGLS